MKGRLIINYVKGNVYDTGISSKGLYSFAPSDMIDYGYPVFFILTNTGVTIMYGIPLTLYWVLVKIKL